jgi:hypothetical protein
VSVSEGRLYTSGEASLSWSLRTSGAGPTLLRFDDAQVATGDEGKLGLFFYSV